MIKKSGFKRKATVLLIIALVGVLLLGGCGAKEKPENPNFPKGQKEVEQIDINIVVGGGPTAVSLAKMFEDTQTLGDNISINYTVAKGGADILTSQVLSGEGDFVMMPSNVAAKLYNQKVPYQMVAANTWGVLYLVSNGIEINSFEDLKGQEIAAIAKGATPDIQFRYFLEKSGLDPEKDVKIVYRSGPEELATYMIAEKDKLSIMPEPWLSMAQDKNENLEIALDFQEEWKKMHQSNMAAPQAVFLVKNSLVEAHPDVVTKVIEEYRKSLEWVNENPSEAGVLVNKHALGMPSDIAAQAIPRCNILYKSALEARPFMEEYFQVLLDFNPETIGGKLPDDGFYYVQK